MNGIKTFVAILLLGGAVFGAVVWSGTEKDAAATVALRPDAPDVVRAGRQVYLEHCASCHGKKLEGQPNWRQRLANGRLPAPPHDQSGHTWHHPDTQLFRITKYGPAKLAGGDYQSDMPGYAGTLADGEIIAVLSFIKSTWSSAIRERHDAINGRAGRN